ncbi:MAG: ABC transporter ATP-binding protein [Actinobacteria bacterium]|nr:ABC transporter ATP-binding protein [Actinomycetota bacterium]
MTDDPGLAIRGLTKSFGEIEAVAGVELDVPRGAVFGLLGPDGAGKSTLIRMLATVLVPDAGDAEIFGLSAAHSPDRLTPRIGYMSQRFSMYPDLSVAENLEFFARIRGVPKPRRRERAPELLESMGMAPFAKRQARLLSGGMKQKLMLASTLMHDPDLLLLDEPTTGVDPVSRREFWRILADIHAEGRTVLVATPYMDEAERCTHVGFMDAGRITHSGTPQELKDAIPGTLLEVIAPDPRAVLAALRDQPGISGAHLLGNTVRVLVARRLADEAPPPGSAVIPDTVRDLLPANAEIRPVEMDMESVFSHLAEEAAA